MGNAVYRRPLRTPALQVGNSQLKYKEVSLTAAQVKALRATPQTIASAPGAGYVAEFVSAVLIMDYVAAFTESADNLAFKYTNGSGAACSDTVETTGFLGATSDQIRNAVAVKDVTMVENAAIVLHNTGDGEFGGTGSPMRIKLTYRIHKTGL